MNKTININLGGYAYTVDEDGYKLLKDYLQSLKKYFKNAPSSDEIVRDIEYRMAEILEQDKTSDRRVIEQKDIQELITMIGTTDEFEYNGQQSDSDTEETSHDKANSKRLFRNTEDKVIGGVCSGLAAYFGIDEAIYVRIMFVISFFSFGIGVLPYVLIWIFAPKAMTAHDKMSMRGEDISISSLAKSLEDEMKNVGNTINEIGKAFKKKSNV